MLKEIVRCEVDNIAEKYGINAIYSRDDLIDEIVVNVYHQDDICTYDEADDSVLDEVYNRFGGHVA